MGEIKNEWHSAWLDSLPDCKERKNPGLRRFVDWSFEPTTIDQSEIESFLERQGVDGLAILHVGIGNSSLARRLAHRAHGITGCTVSRREQRLANSLRLPGYIVHLVNKYGPQLRATVGDGYDLVIDNNLASYACCRYHFVSMLEQYAASLKPGGRILTHETGMKWALGDTCWKLSFEDLVALQTLFPLKAERLTETVYALVRLRDPT